MYSIVLTDGKIIHIKADFVEWCKDRTMRFIYDKTTIARINMDNVAGYISTDCEVKGEEK